MVSDNSIFFLRYEDMSSDPLSMAKKVYKFIDQVISNELIGWIVESQKISGQSGGTYSTVRNSTATMTAWRKNISYQNVSSVYRSLACVGTSFQVASNLSVDFSSFKFKTTAKIS